MTLCNMAVEVLGRVVPLLRQGRVLTITVKPQIASR